MKTYKFSLKLTSDSFIEITAKDEDEAWDNIEQEVGEMLATINLNNVDFLAEWNIVKYE